MNGTWTNIAGGDYDTPSNWASNQIASGAGSTADFSTLNIASDVTVTKDSALTIGNLKFGDTNTASGGSWGLVTTNASVLTLDNSGAAPNFTVTPLVPAATFDDAFIGLGVAGAMGFNKLGGGVLTLGGMNPDLRGTVSVNEGTLRATAAATFDYETVITPERTQFHLANGATIQTATNIGDVANNGAGISIAGGGAATLRVTDMTVASFANVGSADPVRQQTWKFLRERCVWIRIGQVEMRVSAVNMTGTTPGMPGNFVLRPNGAGFNPASFNTTRVNLTNAVLSTNTNSFGNTIPLAALSGDATSTLQGGATGTVVTYEIGALNSDTTFAGGITTGAGGINLNKTGTGKLTLSGTLSHTTTNNALPDLRGGITRVTSGTLALSGTASIPGGINDPTLGDLFTTIDLKAGATLDVSGAGTTYTTAPLQQLIGSGRVVGNYNHSQGRLRPGDVPVGNENTATSAAGTLTFANNLNISGGTINFDISSSIGDYNSNGDVDAADYVVWRENLGTSNPLPNRDPGNNGPVSAADFNSWKANFGKPTELIQVTGGSLSGNAVVDVGILPGAAASTYTVINSTTPLTGSVAGWTVNWTGRGTAPTLVQTANQVQLNATALVPPATLNWRGDVSANWDAGAAGTANWRNTGTNAADNFFTRDTARFLDTYDGVNAPATTTITLNQVVSPGAVVVNSSLNYTISGTGRISGASTFVKQGTGRLSITTNNDFSGGATISGGIVDLEQTGRLGSRAITLSGGQLHVGTTTAFNLANDLVIVGTQNVLSTDITAGQVLNVNGRLSGSGALVLANDSGAGGGVTTPVRGVDFFADNSAFTGSITFSNAGLPEEQGPVFLRFRNAASQGTNVAWDIGNNGSTLSQRIDVATPTTFTLGSLSGGPMSGISGFGSGANPGAQSIWRIGTLGTSTEFAGVIADGNTGSNPAKTSAVTKVGAGTLTLSGTNTYTGDTRVEAGSLRTTQAAVLGDMTALFLSTGAIVNLDFDSASAGSDTIARWCSPERLRQLEHGAESGIRPRNSRAISSSATGCST